MTAETARLWFRIHVGLCVVVLAAIVLQVLDGVGWSLVPPVLTLAAIAFGAWYYRKLARAGGEPGAG